MGFIKLRGLHSIKLQIGPQVFYVTDFYYNRVSSVMIIYVFNIVRSIGRTKHEGIKSISIMV